MPRTPPEPADAAAARHPDAIADLIVDAILAGRVAAGQRLGEQALADLFGVSRTLVREALGRLSARGMVEVNARRGWFVVQPSREEAQDAFEARAAIETGLVHALDGPLPASAIRRMKQHVAQERAAIRRGDPGERSYLLGEFHVCFAECTGNALLADILKDLTARTTLIATLYQSNHDAARSCEDHAQIVAALEAGDHALAAQRVRDHILAVSSHLGDPSAADDPLATLRAALLPAATELARQAAARRSPSDRKRLFTPLLAPKAGRTRTRRQPKEP
ncbi:MAG: GntR family transcriptional regulator [Rubrivivax sp.]|nr:GntR family transcriptional regulator [Rubrivivax sp.]